MLVVQGEEFACTLKAIAEGSFLPQDLTDVSSVKFHLILKSTLNTVIELSLENGISIKDAENGLIDVVLPASETSKLTVSRGPKEDNYYLKSPYRGMLIIDIPNRASINITLQDIRVTENGDG